MDLLFRPFRAALVHFGLTKGTPGEAPESNRFMWKALATLLIGSLLMIGSCSGNLSDLSVATGEPTYSREQILNDLRKDAPAFHIHILTSLLDEVLPDLDPHFADRAAHNPWLFGHLLARYGSAAKFERVRRTYERDHLNWGRDS